MNKDILDPATISEFIRDDKLEASKTRMNESISLLDQTIKSMKDLVQSQFDVIYKSKKEEIHQRLLKNFADLMKSSKSEIEVYINGASPEKKKMFQYLQTTTPKPVKKRNTTRAPVHTVEVTSPFDQDFNEMYNDLIESGIDMDKEVILADGSFLYQGHCFSVGDTVYISKLSNTSIQAKVDLVTTEEVTLIFPDRSFMKIKKDDLLQQKIVLNSFK